MHSGGANEDDYGPSFHAVLLEIKRIEHIFDLINRKALSFDLDSLELKSSPTYILLLFFL